MDEQTLYTTFLKGSMIGGLNYEGSHALVYAKYAEENALQKIKFEEVISRFGNLLEENEELELEAFFVKNEHEKLIEIFKILDKKYQLFFLEKISKQRENVELVYQDVLMRTNIFIDDEEIKNIKTVESLKKWEDVHNILQKIVSEDEKAILYFYKKHRDSIKHLIFSKNGDENDAEEATNWALSDLKINLKKTPNIEGYYKWKPIKIGEDEKANLSTYFYQICGNKWIDLFRKKMRYNSRIVEIEGLENSFGEEDSTDDPYFQKKLIVRKAIEKLSNKCKKMYLGEWQENFEDNFNVEILAQKSGNSIGTVYNKSVDCMNELKAIIKAQSN